MRAMLQGGEGTGEYTSQSIADWRVSPTRKYAVFVPVHLGNTFWSICVASSEQDVFADLTTFRNKLAVGTSIFFIVGLVLSTLGARAWLIVKEQEKNARAELEIAQQRNQLAHLSRVSTARRTVRVYRPRNKPAAHRQPQQRACGATASQQTRTGSTEVREILRDIVADDATSGRGIRRLRQLLKRGEVQFQPLSANEIVEEVLRLLRSELIDRGVTVHSELASKFADSARLIEWNSSKC